MRSIIIEMDSPRPLPKAELDDPNTPRKPPTLTTTDGEFEQLEPDDPIKDVVDIVEGTSTLKQGYTVTKIHVPKSINVKEEVIGFWAKISKLLNTPVF